MSRPPQSSYLSTVALGFRLIRHSFGEGGKLSANYSNTSYTD
jgi:hypothetical protein